MTEWKKLSNTEYKYMEKIWSNPGISSEDLYMEFDQATGTKTTIIHRIVEKGYVEVERQGKHYCYTPKITQLEYEQMLMNQQVKKTFGVSSFENLVAAFCGRDKLNKEEVQRLQDLLEDLKND